MSRQYISKHYYAIAFGGMTHILMKGFWRDSPCRRTDLQCWHFTYWQQLYQGKFQIWEVLRGAHTRVISIILVLKGKIRYLQSVSMEGKRGKEKEGYGDEGK